MDQEGGAKGVGRGRMYIEGKEGGGDLAGYQQLGRSKAGSGMFGIYAL